MEINLNENIKEIITILILIILPLLLLVTIISINAIQPWYTYVALITWFGIGMIFYSSIK